MRVSTRGFYILWFCFDALADECRRNVEMSPGAQSGDDTPGGGGIGRRVGAEPRREQGLRREFCL